ncbi:HNH endonuclease domain-containing protein [Flavobacterium sp. UBA7682]|uniref:HNH endonuclease domain-containing protein n=1 Tax=Flavobacterium sp. UBA7682 TaxID=1946560 RepID=UPI0025C3935A|nr:HNH endonuclease domain-containing protein [Flavobacterium sp. UBA7682]
MNLPHSNALPVSKLAASFGNTSATYKFYWLLAILELVEEGLLTIPKRHLFARMIGNAWYTVNYFHVSFGKQDLIQQAVHSILEQERLTIDIKKGLLLPILENSDLKVTQQALYHFNKNVPHWFLSPWFSKVAGENDVAYRKRIYASSQVFENDCLYALYDDYIIINPKWVGYLKANAKILKDFIYWNLTLFLQTRNPNVPDIANKLIRPPFRGSLTNQRKNYWDIVFKELGTVDCIFTNTALTIDHYALDHFIPHAFVSHDLIWNLVPIDISFNSTKSDKLPNMETHFDGFYALQKTAFEIIHHYSPKNKLLEEYLIIYPELNSQNCFDYTRFKEGIQPLVTIAHNNGFVYLP